MKRNGRVGLTTSFYSVRTAHTVRNRVVVNLEEVVVAFLPEEKENEPARRIYKIYVAAHD